MFTVPYFFPSSYVRIHCTQYVVFTQTLRHLFLGSTLRSSYPCKPTAPSPLVYVWTPYSFCSSYMFRQSRLLPVSLYLDSMIPFQLIYMQNHCHAPARLYRQTHYITFRSSFFRLVNPPTADLCLNSQAASKLFICRSTLKLCHN